jgi:two-component system nitrogen regulation sensor histidine kinase NtrY
LISQALTNLLANAADAVAARAGAGAIRVALEQAPGEVRIVVEDDGVGLPEEGRDALTEPYVTRKTKGTGLGLAIVKKIMEDHAGRLVLSDRADGTPGARVVLALPLTAAQTMSEMPRMAHGA